jgi:hypothetical protein
MNPAAGFANEVKTAGKFPPQADVYDYENAIMEHGRV